MQQHISVEDKSYRENLQICSLYVLEIDFTKETIYLYYTIRDSLQNKDIIFSIDIIDNDYDILDEFDINKQDFESYSEQQKQEFYSYLLSRGKVYRVPDFEYDINGSGLICLVMKPTKVNAENIKNIEDINSVSVLIFQETTRADIVNLNTIPNLLLEYKIVDFLYINDNIFDILPEINSTSLTQRKSKMNHPTMSNFPIFIVINFYCGTGDYSGSPKLIVDELFISLITNIPNRRKMFLLCQRCEDDCDMFGNYIEYIDKFPLTSKTLITTYKDYFPSHHTTQIYGGDNFTVPEDIQLLARHILVDMANNCLSGELKMKTIPVDTLLYSLSKTNITKDDLKEGELWAFWDVNDLTRRRVTHYESEFGFHTLNVMKTNVNINLLDLSDPDTILKLYCDPRGTLQFKQWLSTTFSVKINRTLEDENKIIDRHSQMGMDTAFVLLLQDMYPEFEGFIYYLSSKSVYHHNEMCLFPKTISDKLSNIEIITPLFATQVHNIVSLSELDSHERLISSVGMECNPEIELDRQDNNCKCKDIIVNVNRSADMKQQLNYKLFKMADNYPIIINSLTKCVIYGSDNYENNYDVYNTLRDIFKGYIIKSLEPNEEILINVNKVGKSYIGAIFKIKYSLLSEYPKGQYAITNVIDSFTDHVEQYFNIKRKEWNNLTLSQIENIIDDILKPNSEYRFN